MYTFSKLFIAIKEIELFFLLIKPSILDKVSKTAIYFINASIPLQIP